MSRPREELPDPQPRAKGEIPSATHVQTRFGGVNLQSPRQSIGDDEFLWLENVQPIGDGNLQVISSAPSQINAPTILGETAVYSMTANISGTDYSFVFCASGNAYQVKLTSPFTVTKITPSPIFTANVKATQWKNIGILIIDPTAGYFDWNVTNANTLSAISNAVNSLVVTPGTGGYSSPPTLTFTGGGATTQATATSDLQGVSAVIGAAGTGYVVGDILTLVGGTLGSTGSKAQFKVTTIGAGGSVTAVSIFTSGDYTAPPNPGNPVATTGGTGTGCTITTSWGIGPITLTSPGTGYVSPPTITLSAVIGGAGVTAGISASFAGTTIATYAGRAWIGNGRTVAFTDVNTYNSFGGAGGSFVITDSTLHQSITQLITANNFLYIAGDDSFDVLGDVLVSGGSTTFTRTNITASVGTNLPNSVMPYYRSILFGNNSGVYSLAGATPQKISGKLDRLFQVIDFTQPFYACQVMVNNILCAAFLFTFTDSANFSGTAGSRPLIALYFNNKWCFVDPQVSYSAIVSVPIAGVQTMFGWNNFGGNTTLVQLFKTGAGSPTVTIRSKLWAGGSPVQFKQVVKAGLGLFYNGATLSAPTWSVDNELGQSANFVTGIGAGPALAPATSATTSTYKWLPYNATMPDAQYFGVTIKATFSTATPIFTGFAVEHRNVRLWQ